MTRPAKRIGFILLWIIILPVVFFAVYQVSTLSRDEELITDIYTRQLDAILFSVNQYSEDIVNGWRSRIDVIYKQQQTEGDLILSLRNLIRENLSVKLLFISSSDGIIQVSEFFPGKNFITEINSLLNSNSEKISNLLAFHGEGYFRMEPVEEKIIENTSSLVFLTFNQKVCGIVIDPVMFTRDILRPKLQEVSQQEFVLSVHGNTRQKNENIIYSTETDVLYTAEQYKPLWLMPEYSLGIALKGSSIEGIVKERTLINVILVSVLVLLLIAGVWYAFRNINKEIELAQIKSDFVSNVSHELRTPLALISMYSETLEMGRIKDTEKKQEYYNIISQESGRLSRIVNKILSFSKMEAGKRTHHFEKTDINEITERTFDTYKFHLQNNKFKFSLEKEETLPDIIADAEALSEAVVNLIDNAVKYSSDKKEIKISTGRDNSWVYIQVDDKGIGITEEDQKKIFDKFFRVSAGNVYNTKGTGLGLTIVKHIIDAHKGEIQIKSSPGKGSSFRLKFNPEFKGEK
jgi:two-component system, OmpR family, phosphate regulon sensor histidine kinase PhoR